MKKLAVPILLTLIFSVALIQFFEQVRLTPVLASSQGEAIDVLLRVVLILASVVFSLVISFFLYSLLSFRRRPGEPEEGPPMEGSTSLEIAWTVIPLFIVVGLSIYSARILFDITAPPNPEKELEVKVTGFQWAWTFEYPEYGITSPELVLPVNRSVLFRLHATDVIHSFYVPEFRLKMDAIPGIENLIRIRPTEKGTYKVRCAEMCGTGHAYMEAPVRVVDEAAFQEWVTKQAALAQVPAMAEAGEAAVPTLTAVEAGRQYAQQFGCLACHSVDGTRMVGPTWKGLFGHQVILEDGTTVTADETYLRNSIVDPAAQLVRGYPNVMPTTYKDQLTQEQIQAIIEYIKSLR
ncbi:MAG: cytochrome c oxidase subunit II [Anaerolineae bacterium]|nr:cytochrome c oxidase subunit II [Anaerolineae bacterium]MDW8098951.1 cytochrome c oxidase subunit II [Anaerolineae bacterium]